MCDRNKQEIMARELCILQWQVQNYRFSHLQKDPIREYVDTHWEKFITRADEILEMLSNHES